MPRWDRPPSLPVAQAASPLSPAPRQTDQLAVRPPVTNGRNGPGVLVRACARKLPSRTRMGRERPPSRVRQPGGPGPNRIRSRSVQRSPKRRRPRCSGSARSILVFDAAPPRGGPAGPALEARQPGDPPKTTTRGFPGPGRGNRCRTELGRCAAMRSTKTTDWRYQRLSNGRNPGRLPQCFLSFGGPGWRL